jgi:hypothetical protein
MKKINLVGQKFNRLLVIKEAPSIKGKIYFTCMCDCGNETTLLSAAIKGGYTKSCGCYQKQQAAKSGFRHGVSNKTSEYRTWVNMKTRCYNKKVNDKDYIGNGIKVCDRWLNSFANFFEDMGKKPSPLHSIERLESKGDYGPGNCKWGTEEEQVRNKSNNVWIEYNGRRMILTDWARYFGVDQGNLAASLKVKSMEVVYNYYLNKYGELPSKKEYVPPCKRNSPINLRKAYSTSIT